MAPTMMWRSLLHDFYTGAGTLKQRADALHQVIDTYKVKHLDEFKQEAYIQIYKVLLRYVQMGDVYALELMRRWTALQVAKTNEETHVYAAIVPYNDVNIYPHSIAEQHSGSLSLRRFNDIAVGPAIPTFFTIAGFPTYKENSTEGSLQICLMIRPPTADHSQHNTFVLRVPGELVYLLPDHVQKWPALYQLYSMDPTSPHPGGAASVTDLEWNTAEETRLLRQAYRGRSFIHAWGHSMPPFFRFGQQLAANSTAETNRHKFKALAQVPLGLRQFCTFDAAATVADVDGLLSARSERTPQVALYDTVGRALWGGRRKRDVLNALEYVTNEANVSVSLYVYVLSKFTDLGTGPNLLNPHRRITPELPQKRMYSAAIDALIQRATTRGDLAARAILGKHIVKLHHALLAAGSPPPSTTPNPVTDDDEFDNLCDTIKPALPPAIQILQRLDTTPNVKPNNMIVCLNSCAASGWKGYYIELPRKYAGVLLSSVENVARLDSVDEYTSLDMRAALSNILVNEIMSFRHFENVGERNMAFVEIDKVYNAGNTLTFTHAVFPYLPSVACTRTSSAGDDDEEDSSTWDNVQILPVPPEYDAAQPPAHARLLAHFLPRTMYDRKAMSNMMEYLLQYLGVDSKQVVLGYLYRKYCNPDFTVGDPLTYFVLLPPSIYAPRPATTMTILVIKEGAMEVWGDLDLGELSSRAIAVASVKATLPPAKRRKYEAVEELDGSDAAAMPDSFSEWLAGSDNAKQLIRELYERQRFEAAAAAPTVVAGNVGMDSARTAANIRNLLGGFPDDNFDVYSKCVYPDMFTAHMSPEQRDYSLISSFVRNIHTDRWRDVVVFQ